MLKSQLVISVATFLLLSPRGSQARFLSLTIQDPQANDGDYVISPYNPTLAQPNVAFNANLNCGECVVGGYVYCVNGVEGFTGSVPQKGACCQSTKSCPQINAKGWICSSKYDNMTLVDKLRVCPNDPAQCGSQSLNFNELGDSQCLRLRTLKKGSSCLYRVQSKCGVPRLQLNDTSADVFTSSLLVANKTVDRAQQTDKCNPIRNQNCICKENSVNGTIKYVCDCDTAFNIELAPRDCSTCRRLVDNLGNALQQCTCALPYPEQAFEDQLCTCDRITNVTSKATSLSCVCPKPSSARVVSFAEDKCKCLNNYNATTKKAFLDCSCRNTEICSDPKSRIPVPPKAVAAPCLTSYPCVCSAIRQTQNVTGNATNSTSNLQCTCTNPSTALQTVVPSLPVSQCSCQTRINSNSTTWQQECSCCISDEIVRTQLIPPVQCSTGSNKQSCACRNQTVAAVGGRPASFQQVCNCTNPSSQVVAPSLVFNNEGCDCENTAIGNKACTCCVAPEVQAAQLQPKCDSALDSCRCFSDASGRLTCDCDSKKFNFTFSAVTPVVKECFCAPPAINQTQRACNCCISDPQYQQFRQRCPVGSDASACRCDRTPATNTTNASLSCDCANRFFFNQVTPKIALRPQQCACFSNASSSNCSCCTTEANLVVAPKSCNATQVFASCNRCANITNAVTKISSYQCSCNGSHPLSNTTSVLAQNVSVNTSSCGCVNFNGRTTCDCCIPTSSFLTARPNCPDESSSEKCSSCQTQNFTERANRTIVTSSIQNQTFICRRTGFNGDLCANATNNVVTAWNDAMACYTSAKAVCQYQVANQTCGWTSNPALTTCLQKPSKVAAPRTFQNLTFPAAAPVTANVTVTDSRLEFFNVTVSRFMCNCTNSRYPSFPLTNQRVNATQCGCDAPAIPARSPVGTLPSQVCDCCFNRESVDNAFQNSLVCRADQVQASCQFDRNSGFSQCSPLSASVTYRDLRVDTTKSCACVNVTNSTQNCRCCLPSVTAQLIPAGPVCSFGQTNQSNCICDPVGKSANLKCQCPTGTQTRVESFNETIRVNSTTNSTVTRTRNVTEATFLSQILPISNCNCLNTVNNGQSTFVCNCCAFRPLQCPTTQFADVQTCNCQNVTTLTKSWQWNCACTRRSNNIVGQFNITNQTSCNYNPEVQQTQCCITKTQLDTQVPVLTCPSTSVRQNCSCANSTSNGDRNCSCTRADNGIVARYIQPSNNCLCSAPIPNNSTTTNTTNSTTNSTTNNTSRQSCQCCVAQSLNDLQIPRKTCEVEGPGFAPEICQCTTPKASAPTPLICACQRSDFLITQQYNINATFCLNTAGSRFECCLNAQQRAALIPQLTCGANETSQTGCACRNSTTNGRIQQICSCPVTYQKANFTIPGLTSQSNGCICNSTTCGCCLTQSIIELATERTCKANEIRSVCQSCETVADPKNPLKKTLSCTGCDTFPTDSTVVIIRAQSYQNVTEQSCLCRNESAKTNCTCCQAASVVPLLATAPTCSTGSVVASNTRCETVIGNSTARCNITRREGAVETYFTNVSQTELPNCNCFTITNGTQTYRQCQCCALQTRLSPPAPNCSAVVEGSTEQCTCLPVRGPNNTSRLNCDCNYKNIQIVKDINIPDAQCGCLTTNTLARPCACCVSAKVFRDSVAPTSCDAGSPIALCASNVTTTIVGTRSNRTLRGDCFASVSGVNITNNNMTLDESKCACFNDTQGKLQCRCCMSGNQTIRRLPERQCRADELPATCECAGNSTCACTVFNGPFAFSFPTLRPSSSDCGCIQLTQGNRTTTSCSCCQPRSLLNVTAPVCDAATTTTQQCNCRSIFNSSTNTTSQVCDCTRRIGTAVETRNNVPLRVDSQCSCLNQNLGGVNSLNCTCCVPNPPPTLCQRLSANNSGALNCSCRDTIVDGKAISTCDCTQRLNATAIFVRRNMLFDEASQCCCAIVTNPLTKVDSRVCNCTQPAVPQNQNCQCKPAANNASQISCICSDCNNVRQVERFIPQNKCQCRPQSLNVNALNITTNSTSNTTRPANGTSNSTTNTTRPANGTTNSTTNTTRPANGTTNSTTNTTRPANGTTNSTTNTTRPTNGTTNSTSNTTRPANGTSNSTTNTTRPTNGTTNSTTNTTRPANGTTNSTGNTTRPVNGTTNSTSNGTITPSNTFLDCSCQVDYVGLCQQIDFSRVPKVDENSCEAANRPKSPVPTLPTSQCNNEYEYIVAVVAANKDSSVLLNLQSFQAQSGYFFGVSALAFMILALTMMF